MTNFNHPTGQSVGHSLFSNVLSSGLIRILRAILIIVTTPIVIGLLGPEQYALVVFTLTVQMALFMFDYAISPPIVRHFGVMANEPDKVSEMHDLFHSFEWLSLVTAALLGIVIVLAAPYIATNWLQAETMADDHIITAVQLIGVYVAVQWPSLLYSACFLGLRYQSILLLINLAYSIVQFGVIIILMTYWMADIRIFLLIQIISTVLMVLVMRRQLSRLMPKSIGRPSFNPALLGNIKRFAGASLTIGVTATILTQFDKIVASKVFVLGNFSVYGLTFNISGQLAAIMTASIMMSVHPVLAQSLAKGDGAETRRFYHGFSQLNALMVFPSFGCLAFFPRPILQLWLGESSPMVEPIVELLPYVLIGSMVNAICVSPYILQSAAGWVRTRMIISLFQVAVFIIAAPFLLSEYGMVAGAVLWIAINLCYFLIEVPIVHRRYLKGELAYWWIRDTLLPGTIVLSLFVLAKIAAPVFENLLLETLKLALLVMLTAIISLGVMPELRKMTTKKFSSLMH